MPYHRARQFLAALDDDWARHVAAIGPCLHQPQPTRDPYEALVRAIAYQQLHVRAGDAIVGRLLALFPGQPFPTAAQLLASEFDDLRRCGFSASKIATIQGIAGATLSGASDWSAPGLRQPRMAWLYPRARSVHFERLSCCSTSSTPTRSRSTPLRQSASR